tara:strand:+ start:28291 stop:28719 length:429 start_codon:yes stop_codon:yes gene_type:complete
VKINQRTYQHFVKAVAVLLLAALFMPTGLHAKQLVDFCKPSPIEQPMASDHSCCDKSDENETSNSHPNHICDWSIICACNVSLSILNNTEWIVTNNNFTVTLIETETLSLLVPSTELIHSDQQLRIDHFKPPLWLLYDTYLI